MNSIIERWMQTAATNCSTAPSSGTNDTYFTHSANTSSSTTTTDPQGIANTQPLQLPSPITDQTEITGLDIRRHQRLGGILNEYHHAA